MKKILLFASFLFFTASTTLFAQHPVNLNTTNETLTSADLNWDPNTSPTCLTSINLRYREVTSPTPPWSATITNVTSPYLLTGLTAGTTYEWTAKCAQTSGWPTAVQFTTLFPATYNCDSQGNCSDPLDGTGTYTGATALANCNAACFAVTYDCDGLGNCTDPGDGSGFYTGATALTSCNTACVIPDSWNCESGTCVDPGTGTGTYSTLAGCQTACGQISISNITITDSIDCFGGFASVKVDINQIAPPDTAKVIFGYYSSSYFISYAPIEGTLGTYVNVSSQAALFAREWTVRLVDSIPYFSANSLGSGTSMVGVFDEQTLTITHPPQLGATNTLIADNLCFGDCDAQQEIVISGGTEPYSYTWNGQSVPSTTVTLGPQSYDITNTGNTFTPDTIECNIGDTIIFNLGASHDAVEVDESTWIAGGNTPNGGFSFGLGATNAEFIPTSAQTYYYVCTPHASIGMTGVIIVNNAPLNTSTDTIWDLCEGNYTLAITDANNCQTGSWDTNPSSAGQWLNFTSYTNDFYISEPPALVPAGNPYLVNNNSLHISCMGANDGFMEDLNLTTGGTGPYTFAVDNGPFGDENSIDSITGSFAGILHTIYYRDDNGCLDSLDFTFNEPALLELSLVVATPASCFGYQDGTISVATAGGAGNEVFSTDGINFSYNSTIITPLYGDSNYVVTVQDGNSCEDTIHVYLSEPTEIGYSTYLQDYNGVQISCFGAADGQITFGNPSGGSGTYQYSIDNGGSYTATTVYPNLPAGTYDLSVEDSDGCLKDTTVALSSAGQSAFEVNATVTSNYNGSDVSCFGDCNGEISVTSAFGINPNAVTYEFDNSGGFSLTNVWGSLCAGSYSIDAVDDNGCTANTSINIVAPPVLTGQITSTDEFCNAIDGEVDISPNGGTGAYLYSWSGPNSYTSSNSNNTNLDAGIYSCIVTDDNGCTITDSEVVLDDIPFELTLTTTPTCPGDNSGSATVAASALGSHTLSTTQLYQWDDLNFQQTQTASNLFLGTYTVTVEDPNISGCIISATVDIDTTLFSVSIASIDISHISCHDADDGEITIHASGGTSPYDYSLNAGAQQTDSVYSSLIEGSYTIEVEDVSGCTASQVIDIINPPSLYIDTTIVNPVQCNGESNASIQAIVAVGGTGTYEYSVNGGFSHTNMSYFINYGAGTYTVEVQDINNCFSQDIVVIEEPPVLAVSITTPELLWNNYQVRCYGDTNSFANIVCNGGLAPYYNICIDSAGDTIHAIASVFSNLRQDTYTFYTTDALGCVSSQSITYQEPPIIEHHFIPTHVTCNGWNNGALIDSVYGGVGGSINAYTYLWDTGEITYAIDSISIGDYTVIVTDMNNCISTETFTSINDNNALSANVDLTSTTDVSCYNYCDGEITAAVTGGIPNINSFGDSIYYYLWDDTLAQSTQSATGLCVDSTLGSSTIPSFTTYSCIITDLQGCSDTITHTITQPPAIYVDASIVSPISCFDGNDGKLTVAANGGAGGFTFMWSPNLPLTYSPNPNNNNVSAGEHIVTVKDQNGCIGSDSITLIEPPEMTLVVSNTNISCYGFEDGTILVDADGGTPFLGIPPEYQYSFYNESGTQIDIETDITSETEELAPGIYTVIAEDMNGCTIESGTIYISQPGDPLTVSFSTQDATCAQNNGQASVFVFGGTSPYEYNWDNGQTSTNMIGLESGYYPINLIDNNDCIIRDSAFVMGVQNVFLPNNLSAIEHTICLGDSVYLDIDEHDGTTYQWENGSTVADRWVYPDKRENTYVLTIWDVGCAGSYSVYATIHVDFVEATPTSIPAGENGNYPIIVSGEQIQLFSDNNDCDSYEWTWGENTEPNQSVIDNPDVSTWYYINVDSAYCSGYDSIYVVVGVLPYEGITPNGDGYNDTWAPIDIGSYPEAIVQIFNRWGAIIFESTGGADYQAWDGTNKGKDLPVGTYYYIIDLKTEDEPQSGPITIIR